MAKIGTYITDDVLQTSDKWIGTDGAGSLTKNYTLGDVTDYINTFNTLDSVTTNGDTTSNIINVGGLVSTGSISAPSGTITTLTSTTANIGTANITGSAQINYTQYDQNPTGVPAGVAGTVYWNEAERCLDVVSNGTTLQVGQEQVLPLMKAQSAIRNGSPVYYAGAVGNSGVLEINNFSASPTGGNTHLSFAGLATEAIAQNATGFVTRWGKVRGIDGNTYSSGGIKADDDPGTWAVGVPLWVSATQAGALTSVPPESPNYFLPVASITRVAGGGSDVDIQVGVNLGSTLGFLHDVELTSPLANEMLYYNGSTERWEHTADIRINSIALGETNDFPAIITNNKNCYITQGGGAPTDYALFIPDTQNTQFFGKLGVGTAPELGYQIASVGGIKALNYVTEASTPYFRLRHVGIGGTLTVGQFAYDSAEDKVLVEVPVGNTTDDLALRLNNVEYLHIENGGDVYLKNANVSIDGIGTIPQVFSTAGKKVLNIVSATNGDDAIISLISNNTSTSFIGVDGSAGGEMVIGNEGTKDVVFKNAMSFGDADPLNGGSEMFRLTDGKVVLKHFASAPAGQEGAIYYDSTTKKHYGHDGTTWNALY